MLGALRTFDFLAVDFRSVDTQANQCRAPTLKNSVSFFAQNSNIRTLAEPLCHSCTLHGVALHTMAAAVPHSLRTFGSGTTLLCTDRRLMGGSLWRAMLCGYAVGF